MTSGRFWKNRPSAITALATAFLCAVMPISNTLVFGASEEGNFDNYEIRVIRPKFFSKTGRLELGGEFHAIMNQTFVYSFLATGILDYHFNEMFALEVNGSYGFTVPKEDKRLLQQDFTIETQIVQTQYQLMLAGLWTPVYGKYQLSSGRLIYFDTFLTLGGGLTGVEHTYDHCKANDKPGQVATVVPANHTQSYMTGLVGIGQKFFLNKNTALRWDVRLSGLSIPAVDQSCTPEYEVSGESKTHFNTAMQFGASYFL